MSKPNRVMANARRVQNSSYDCFSSFAVAAAFEGMVSAAGFKTRSSKFRVGPRGVCPRFSYRVSVYWNEGAPAPDMAAFRAAVAS